MVDHIDAAVNSGPEEFTLGVMKRRGQKAFVDTTRIDRIWRPPLVDSDWGARCARRCMMEWNRRIWRESMYNTLREGAKKVDIKKIGERTNLLWKLSERKRESYFDEKMKGQVKGTAHERKWAASRADALGVW